MKQFAFDPLDYVSDEDLNLHNAHKLAKQARDARYKELKKEGKIARRFVLRGQLRKYAGFGIPDGRVRDIYYIDVMD